MFRLVFFYFATGLTRALPLPVLYRVVDWIADLAYYLDRGRAQGLKKNLEHITQTLHDPRPVSALARRSYRHMATYMAEFFGTPGYPPHALAQRVRITGQEHLEAALRQGRGVLLLSAHYSNWELCASMVAYLGYPVHVVANQHPNPRVQRLFQQPRAHNGVQTLDVYHSVRPTFKLLKQNSVVALMADRDLSGTGIPIQFFGRAVAFPRGPARFAIGSRAPVVFTFIRRRHDRSYELTYSPPIFPPTSGEREANVAALTQSFARIIESEVAKDPTQYTVFFPIWEASAPRYPDRVASA